MDAMDEVVNGYRVRTWVERQNDGWYLVVGFWWKEFPRPGLEEDDRIDVGPWATHAIAEAELTTGFREIIKQGLKEFAAKHGGFVTDGRALDRNKGWPTSS